MSGGLDLNTRLPVKLLSLHSFWLRAPRDLDPSRFESRYTKMAQQFACAFMHREFG